VNAAKNRMRSWFGLSRNDWKIIARGRRGRPGKKCGLVSFREKRCKMREVVWTRGAEADLQFIFDQLSDLRDGAGEEFLILLDAAIELLKQFPEMAPTYESPFRRLVVKDGRHGLFYTIEGRRVILHAVADLRGNPELLRERFKRLRP
jgi:plasmid stabilization system protein ParE